MERGIVGFALWLLVFFGFSATATERANKSLSGGLLWTAPTEEGDLPTKAVAEDFTLPVDQNEEFDHGGFSSLDGMLQWAIAHSDPVTLKERSQEVQHLLPDELKKRHVEIKELMENLKTPSDAQLMQIAIDDLNNSSLSLEDHLRALQELLILVEPIDSANDLNKLGGFAVIIRELNNADPEMRKISAWILGKASQNNPIVQKLVLELGALTHLMKMTKSKFVDESAKALYAISALIRNNIEGQELFYAEAGDLMLQDILSNSSVDIKVCKKVVFLVGDLVLCQLEAPDKAGPPLFSNRFFLKSIVDLTASTDVDLLEKVLTTIKNLLQLKTTGGSVWKDFCGLEEALKRTRQQLQQLMLDESQRDYVMELERLRDEVEQTFLRKLEHN